MSTEPQHNTNYTLQRSPSLCRISLRSEDRERSGTGLDTGYPSSHRTHNHKCQESQKRCITVHTLTDGRLAFPLPERYLRLLLLSFFLLSRFESRPSPGSATRSAPSLPASLLLCFVLLRLLWPRSLPRAPPAALLRPPVPLAELLARSRSPSRTPLRMQLRSESESLPDLHSEFSSPTARSSPIRSWSSLAKSSSWSSRWTIARCGSAAASATFLAARACLPRCRFSALPSKPSGQSPYQLPVGHSPPGNPLSGITYMEARVCSA